jgi:hypothetical protein
VVDTDDEPRDPIDGEPRAGRDETVPPRESPPARTSPYPVSRLAPPFDLVDVAREIAAADALVGAVAGEKLGLIADQIRALQAQARAVLEAARRDAELHRAACNFQKRPGQVYHLYRSARRGPYLSMLSPDDWRGAPPDPFAGSFRLEVDQSWTPLEAVAERDEHHARTRRLLGGG